MKTSVEKKSVVPSEVTEVESTTQADENVDLFLGVLIRIADRLERDRALSTASLTDLEKRDRVSGAKVDKGAWHF